MSGKHSMLHAAKLYHNIIPKSTLHDQMSGKVIHGQIGKCWLYPFNPDVIDWSISVANVEGPDRENDDDNINSDQKSGEVSEDISEGSKVQQSSLSNEKVVCEQLALFQWRGL